MIADELQRLDQILAKTKLEMIQSEKFYIGDYCLAMVKAAIEFGKENARFKELFLQDVVKLVFDLKGRERR